MEQLSEIHGQESLSWAWIQGELWCHYAYLWIHMKFLMLKTIEKLKREREREKCLFQTHSNHGK